MLNDFISFLKVQPADRAVNHDSWDSCAVGDFINEDSSMIGIPIEKAVSNIKTVGHPRLYDILASPGPFNAGETYGELVQCLLRHNAITL